MEHKVQITKGQEKLEERPMRPVNVHLPACLHQTRDRTRSPRRVERGLQALEDRMGRLAQPLDPSLTVLVELEHVPPEGGIASVL